MIKCMLLLTQGTNSVEITLERGVGGSHSQLFTQWGKFSSTEGNIPPERKMWLHALAKWELTLTDGGGPGVGMVGGGLKFGEMAELQPAAILSSAGITSRGVEPVNGSDVGIGNVLNGMNMSIAFHSGPITWRLTGFKIPGASAWQSP